jgi:prephenate dehydratase
MHLSKVLDQLSLKIKKFHLGLVSKTEVLMTSLHHISSHTLMQCCNALPSVPHADHATSKTSDSTSQAATTTVYETANETKVITQATGINQQIYVQTWT